MAKEKSLGQILGERVLESLSEEERAKVVTVTLKFDPVVTKEIHDYLEKLHRFQEASRKVEIKVGGEGCGYCRRARELQQMLSPSYSS